MVVAWAGFLWHLNLALAGAATPPLIILDLPKSIDNSTAWVFALPADPARSPIVHRGNTFQKPPFEVDFVCAGAQGIEARCVEMAGPEPIRLRLGRGQVFRGRLFGEKSVLKGAAIAVVPADLRSKREFLMPLGVSEGTAMTWLASNASGEFQIGPLGAGTYRLLVRLSTGARIPVPDVIALVGVGRPLDLGDILIDGGSVVNVSVVDSMGEGVGGAKVQAYQSESSRAPGRIVDSITNSSGMALVSGLSPSFPVHYLVKADGFSPATFRRDSPEYEVAVRLARPEPLEVNVIDEAGAPLADSTVSTDAGPAVTTDETGLACMTGLPVGSVTLRVRRPGYVPLETQLDIPAEPITLQLRAAPMIPSAVLARRTGEAVGGARVESVPPGLVLTKTDPEGHFQLPDVGPSLELLISADGFLSTHFRYRHGETARFELPDSDEAGWLWISAQEPNSSGEACRRCEVGIRADSSASELFLYTGLDGTVASPPLPPGTYVVSISETQNLGDSVFVSSTPARVAVVRSAATTRVQFLSRMDEVSVEVVPPLPQNSGIVVRGRSTRTLTWLVNSRVTLKRMRGESLELFYRPDPVSEIYLGTVPADTESHQIRTGESQIVGQSTDGMSEIALMNSGRMVARIVTNGPRAVRFFPLGPGRYELVLGGIRLREISLGARQDLDLGLLSR